MEAGASWQGWAGGASTALAGTASKAVDAGSLSSAEANQSISVTIALKLGDLAGATKTFDAFLKKFPHSAHKREAQEARAELALLQNSAPAEAVPKSAIARSASSDAERQNASKRAASPETPARRPYRC